MTRSSTRPHRHDSTHRITPTSAAPVVVLVSTVFFCITLILINQSNNPAAWGLIPDSIAATALLLGVIGLVHCAWSRRLATPERAVSSAALVLAGGLRLGGGWTAALALGLLIAAWLFWGQRAVASEAQDD